MATIWARTGGAWNTSIWDYFNENTQQVEAYPFAEPQIGDYVYLNGKTVTVNATQTSTIDIGNGTISREINPKTSLGGGFIDIMNNVNSHPTLYIVANLQGILNSIGTIIRHGVSNDTTRYYVLLNITGNMEWCQITASVQGAQCSILGNVSNSAFTEGSVANGTSRVVITGSAIDVIYNNPASRIGYLQVNGSLKQGRVIFSNVSSTVEPLIVVGNFTPYNNLKLPHNIKVNGTIDCAQNSNICPIDTGYYMITSSADGLSLIASTDYPPESAVKKDVPYAWGEMTGILEQPPETVVLKDYVYDTITAEENDIATYNLTRYIYADYGTLHWFELKTTTTDIVTTPSQQSITIDGDTIVADTDYVVEYNDICYQWSGSAWGSITTKNIGTVKTDIVTNPTETTLGVKKGTLETIPQATLSRMQNALTVDIFQQILDAHLNN